MAKKIRLTEAEKLFFRHFLRQSGDAFPSFLRMIEDRGSVYQDLGMVLSASEHFECMEGEMSAEWPWSTHEVLKERIAEARRYFAEELTARPPVNPRGTRRSGE